MIRAFCLLTQQYTKYVRVPQSYLEQADAKSLGQISPLEFGSWDPSLSALVNLTYVGTHLTNGQPPNSTGCVTGFDQVGFMMGTSASLFNVSMKSSSRDSYADWSQFERYSNSSMLPPTSY
jgi:Lysophospholipase catalytic domain